MQLVRSTFDTFDSDSSGFISAAELRDALLHMGQSPSEEEVARLFTHVDLNHDGRITFDELLKLVEVFTSIIVPEMIARAELLHRKSFLSEEEQAAHKEAFEFFDADGSGSISTAEVCVLVCDLCSGRVRCTEGRFVYSIIRCILYDDRMYLVCLSVKYLDVTIGHS
jgi:Ca2+-binding EF-hand superfamily protein